MRRQIASGSKSRRANDNENFAPCQDAVQSFSHSLSFQQSSQSVSKVLTLDILPGSFLIKGATGEFSDALLALALRPPITAFLLLRARRSRKSRYPARGA